MSIYGIGKWGSGAAGAAAVVALVAACGTSSAKPTVAGASSTAQSKPAVNGSSSALKTTSTSIGPVLVDASGRTVYELVGDSAANQTCTGGCLAIWPPVMANGSQLIVNGHPAFTFAGDSSAGQTKGHNVTNQWGRWLALDGSGNPISAPGAASSKAPTPSASTKAPNGGSAAF